MFIPAPCVSSIRLCCAGETRRQVGALERCCRPVPRNLPMFRLCHRILVFLAASIRTFAFAIHVQFHQALLPFHPKFRRRRILAESYLVRDNYGCSIDSRLLSFPSSFGDAFFHCPAESYNPAVWLSGFGGAVSVAPRLNSRESHSCDSSAFLERPTKQDVCDVFPN